MSLGPFGMQRGTQEDRGLFFFLFFLCGTFACRTLSQAIALIPEVQRGKDEEDLVNRHLWWCQKPCLALGTTAASHSQTCCTPNPSLIDSEDLLYPMYLLLNDTATMWIENGPIYRKKIIQEQYLIAELKLPVKCSSRERFKSISEKWIGLFLLFVFLLSSSVTFCTQSFVVQAK